MLGRGLCLILIPFALSLGCTKAEPEFDLLDGDAIPRPLFSGSTTKSITTSSPSETFAISGQCDSKIRAITGMAVGTQSSFGTVDLLSTAGATVTCQTDGVFSFTLKSLTDLGYTAQEGTTYEIQLRSVTSAGVSKPSSIKILFQSPNNNGPKRMVLTSGGTESGGAPRIAASTSFKAEIRVDHRMNQYGSASTADAMHAKSSTSFKAKIGSAAAQD